MADKTAKALVPADVDGVRTKFVDQADGTWAELVAVVNATASGLNAQVVGPVAHDGVVSGNPVRVAGKANSAAPTNVQAGDVADVWVGLKGQIVVAGNSVTGDGANNAVQVLDAAGNDRPFAAAGMGYNGATNDRLRTNIDITALSSAARTSTLNSGDLTNYNGRGLHVVLDVTVAGTGSITLTIQAKDALSGQYYTLLAGAAVVSISTNVYKVYPGGVVTANASANDILPRTYRILVTHNNANSITYSVGASVIL